MCTCVFCFYIPTDNVGRDISETRKYMCTCVFCFYIRTDNVGRDLSETITSTFTEHSGAVDSTLASCLNRPLWKVPIWNAQRLAHLTEAPPPCRC
jgi:hypothetical protein